MCLFTAFGAIKKRHKYKDWTFLWLFCLPLSFCSVLLCWALHLVVLHHCCSVVFFFLLFLFSSLSCYVKMSEETKLEVASSNDDRTRSHANCFNVACSYSTWLYRSGQLGLRSPPIPEFVVRFLDPSYSWWSDQQHASWLWANSVYEITKLSG